MSDDLHITYHFIKFYKTSSIYFKEMILNFPKHKVILCIILVEGLETDILMCTVFIHIKKKIIIIIEEKQRALTLLKI